MFAVKMTYSQNTRTVPGILVPGCPRRSYSGCRYVGTFRPGHLSKELAVQVQHSGKMLGCGLRAPASLSASIQLLLYWESFSHTTAVRASPNHMGIGCLADGTQRHNSRNSHGQRPPAVSALTGIENENVTSFPAVKPDDPDISTVNTAITKLRVHALTLLSGLDYAFTKRLTMCKKHNFYCTILEKY